jgi:hypothetical protein
MHFSTCTLALLKKCIYNQKKSTDAGWVEFTQEYKLGDGNHQLKYAINLVVHSKIILTHHYD